MRGGSAGEPKVICAAAGCAVATPHATRMPVPARPADRHRLILFPRSVRSDYTRTTTYPKRRTSARKQNPADEPQARFIRSVASTSCSRMPGSIAE
jgi:hypothetical protein